MNEQIEKINAYMCGECMELTITVERVKGTTPMFLGCRASGDERSCKGRATSMMYRIDILGEEIVPAWEWYKPKGKEIRKESIETREHIRKGGLLLRKIE